MCTASDEDGLNAAVGGRPHSTSPPAQRGCGCCELSLPRHRARTCYKGPPNALKNNFESSGAGVAAPAPFGARTSLPRCPSHALPHHFARPRPPSPGAPHCPADPGGCPPGWHPQTRDVGQLGGVNSSLFLTDPGLCELRSRKP